MGRNKSGARGRQPVGKRALRERRRREKERNRRLRIGAVVLLALLLAAYAFWPRPAAEPVSAARLADDPAKGPEGAPVTITEFGDFGCPSCRWWHQNRIFDRIIEQYGEQVRIVWRDLPVITPQSPKAAQAAQCAHDQGRFWEYHDMLFERGRLSARDLKEYASELGLDTETFEGCLDSGRHEETVERDMREAFRLGFRGTPSFIINDQPILGVNPNQMIQMIDSLLARQ